jgi:4-amino-4-deoxy-L-arabinose transferase-like glycosyltransferase
MPSAETVPLPRSLVACLPLLWQRVLFPGASAEPSPLSWRALALLIVLPGLLLYPCLAFPLFDPDEGRYAEVPREMLARNEWVVPYLQGEPYLDKPPLFYWLVMVSYRLFGVSDAAARLVPALALHGTLLTAYLFGRRVLGGRAGLVGALLLGLAPGFIGMGRLLILDGLLTFWVTLTLVALFHSLNTSRLQWGWWLLAALACGLGVLTKGPIALLLTAPPVWLHRRLTGAPRLAGRAALAAFLAVVLAGALPWYVAACLRLPAFARHFLWEHNVLRFLAPFDHLEPVWFYAPVLLLGLLPATFLAPALGRFLLTGDEATSRRRSPELGFLLLTGGWCVLFFSLSGCKLATYVLPAFPPLCLALGALVTAHGWEASRGLRLGGAAAYLLLLAGHHLGVPWFARLRAPMGRPDEVLALCRDPQVPIVCYPRNCDSVAFYLRRDDLTSYRSKHTHLLIGRLREAPRTIVLCTHRHTLSGLRQALPPDLRIVRTTHLRVEGEGLIGEKLGGWLGETALGLCDIAVVERAGSLD